MSVVKRFADAGATQDSLLKIVGKLEAVDARVADVKTELSEFRAETAARFDSVESEFAEMREMYKRLEAGQEKLREGHEILMRNQLEQFRLLEKLAGE